MPCGSTGVTVWEAVPHTRVALDWTTMSTPSVAMTRVSGAAVRSGRMISGWTTPARTATRATVTAKEGSTPQCRPSRNSTL